MNVRLLLIHSISVFITVIVVALHKRSVEHSLATLLITSVFPIGGIFLVGLFYINPKLKQDNPMLDASYDFIKKEKSNYSLTQILNFDKETNVVPLEEALLLSDLDMRREVILNVLKKDVVTYSNYINMALMNDDSETSHYAASSILHAKRKLDLSMHEVSTLYYENLEDHVIALSYADLLHEYMRSVYLGKEDKESYVRDSICVLEKIITKKWTTDQTYMLRLIQLFLGKKDSRKLASYCNLFFYGYPDTEEKYILLLEAFFIIQDKKNFDFILKSFRASNLSFSNETLTTIRFWLGVIA